MSISEAIEIMERSAKIGIVTFLLALLPLNAAQTSPRKPIVSAAYIFGDSTADPGNNDGLATIFKANFPPYGRDLADRKPTGRFTNGKLVTDILSGLVGLPELLPAYLDSRFQGKQMLTGASFASAAAGYYDSTSLSLNVLTLGQQVEYFRQYKGRIANMVGAFNASEIISGGLFGISMGTNDFALNYYMNPILSEEYSVTQFQDLLLHSLSAFVQSIYTEGARRLAVIGLPPFGCLPSQITIHNVMGNTCIDEYNDVAVSFNQKIVLLLETLKPRFPGLTMIYIDIYDKLFDIIQHPGAYGFEQTRTGCCGTGLIETTYMCNSETPTCPDASKYVFWDSVHPTSHVYAILAQNIFSQALPLIS